jgi:hypothetical protein
MFYIHTKLRVLIKRLYYIQTVFSLKPIIRIRIKQLGNIISQYL